MDEKEKILRKILWDVPEWNRDGIIKDFYKNKDNLLKNNSILIKIFNSVSWYDILKIFGLDFAVKFLNSGCIDMLYPPSRKEYYLNAKRLLSKYSLSDSG